MKHTINPQFAKLVLKLHTAKNITQQELDLLQNFLRDPVQENFLKKNVVLIRTIQRCSLLGLELPFQLKNSAKQEEERIQKTISIIGELGDLCEKNGIPFVFTKAFQHYPDMGHDIDLLILDTSKKIHSLLKEKLNAKETEGSLLNRISKKTNYDLPQSPTPLELHSGLIGHIGEHSLFPKLLSKRLKKEIFQGITTPLPSNEDQLILQVIQRMYGHFFFRLTDLLNGFKLLSDQSLDWNYIKEVVSRINIEEGLLLYHQLVKDLFSKVLGEKLSFPSIPLNRKKKYSQALYFEDFHYFFSYPWIPASLFMTKLGKDIVHGQWESALHLSAVPFIGGVHSLKKLTRFLTNFPKMAERHTGG